jgi:hypothetical protein
MVAKTKQVSHTYFDIVEVSQINGMEGPQGLLKLKACIANADNMFELKKDNRVVVVSVDEFETMVVDQANFQVLKELLKDE